MKAGTFEPADYGHYSFMDYGGASLVVDEALAGPATVAAAKAKEKEIMDGLVPRRRERRRAEARRI